MRRSLAIAVSIVLVAIAAPPAHATHPAIQTTADSGPNSLRAAIQAATTDETINVPPGTYTLTAGQLQILNKDLTLNGTAGASATRIAAGGAFRVLCIDGVGVDVTISGLTLSGGRAANAGNCGDGQGGGIHDTGTGSLTVQGGSVIEGNTATTAQGGGGGIFKEAGGLTVIDSTVRNNRSTGTSALGTNGGGGIRWTGATSFDLRDSTLSGNAATIAGPASGGGGLYTDAVGADVANVTFSGNTLSVSGTPGLESGGGAIFARLGGGLVDHVTFATNTSGAPGGAIASGGAGDVQLRNSIVRGSNAPACAPGDISSLGGNVDGAATCAVGGGDKPNTAVPLGGLANNGSNNGTQTHELLARSSPAVEFSVTCIGSDQRGVAQFGDECDAGSYEYDGRASAAVPPCSPTGQIPVTLDDPPGGDIVNMTYRLNGSGELQLDTGPVASGPFVRTLPLSEGRHQLEYWGQWTNGSETGHNVAGVLVDQTKPRVAVTNPAPFRVFVIKRNVKVDVDAADALSGLTSDPSGSRPLNTASRGS